MSRQSRSQESYWLPVARVLLVGSLRTPSTWPVATSFETGRVVVSLVLCSQPWRSCTGKVARVLEVTPRFTPQTAAKKESHERWKTKARARKGVLVHCRPEENHPNEGYRVLEDLLLSGNSWWRAGVGGHELLLEWVEVELGWGCGWVVFLGLAWLRGCFWIA